MRLGSQLSASRNDFLYKLIVRDFFMGSGMLSLWFVIILTLTLSISSPAQTLTTLYSFQGGADGSFPGPGLALRSGDGYYGTTGGGGTNDVGTVFKLIPPGNRNLQWAKSTLYSFTGGKDGAFPFFTNLVFDDAGAVYGTTEGGGEFGFGAVFKL